MKTRQKVILGIMSLIALSLLINFRTSKKTESQRTLASMNFIKCTAAKFMLSDVDTTKQLAPLFSGLGDMSYPISTGLENSQSFFNQGLKLTYGFNHAEAHRSFMEASRLDKNAAMAFWGQAYALGPNINDPLPDAERKLKAWEAIQTAKKLGAKATQKEKDLIEALEYRYSADTAAETAILNSAYMQAMEKVAKKYPEDDHVLTLYAASVMNTTPWNYWDKDGNPSENIPAAKQALEKAISVNPNNPGAHHYYIHMVELPNPDLAVPSADALGKLMPSAGHILHMPSHIYIRVGRYLDAVQVNQKAILADEDYISQCYSQGMYPLGYYPHNIHFLWSAASLLGDSDLAIEAAKKTAEKVPVGELKTMHFLQNFSATPLLAYVRFGKWNEILTTPSPNADIKHLKMIWHYARGVAFVRKDNPKEAKEELMALKELVDDAEMQELMASGFDSSSALAEVAYQIVAGELALLNNEHDKAIKHLKKAVELEDNLVYNEPSAWHIPPRHNLGAALLTANKFEEAEMVYKEDLRDLRQNGWSLMGLYQSLSKQGKQAEAAEILKEFKEAWKHADVEIDSSVL